MSRILNQSLYMLLILHKTKVTHFTTASSPTALPDNREVRRGQKDPSTLHLPRCPARPSGHLWEATLCLC